MRTRTLSVLAATLLWATASVSTAETVLQQVERLSNETTAYHQKGQYKNAIAAAERALELCERELGPDHPYTAIAMGNLAILYKAIGEAEKARPLYERELATAERVNGPNHPDTASALSNLGAFYSEMGEYSKAEPLMKRALAIREKVMGPAALDTMYSLNNLAALYEDIGDYARAEPLYQRALAICEKKLGEQHASTATLINNLGELYSRTGNYAKAEEFIRRSMAIREKVSGKDSEDVAGSLNTLAVIYKRTGAYTKAEPLLVRALAIHEKTLGADHPITSITVANLALLYKEKGDYEKSEQFYKRALSVRERTLGPEHPDTAIAVSNLASLYSLMGNYAKSEPLDRRALAIREKVLGPDHASTAESVNALAYLYQVTGEYAKALPLFKRALATYEKSLGPTHPDAVMALANLAWLNVAMGNYAEAETLNERILKTREDNTRALLLSGSEARKLAYLQRSAGYTFGTVHLSLLHPTKKSIALAFTSVLQYKGRGLDAMADSMAALRRNVSPADRGTLEQLSANAQELSTLTFRGRGSASAEEHRQRLDELSRRQETLEVQLASRSSTLRQTVAPITLESVREALPADTVLVEWIRYLPLDPKAKEDVRWGEARYAAYVLKKSAEPVAIELGPAKPIDELVASLRGALADSSITYFPEVSKELAAKVFEPLRPALGPAKRLLLSPDSVLNLVPFAALMDSNGEYLAKQWELGYLTSGRDLLRMAAESPASSAPVIVADPNYGRGNGALAFTRLEGTATEAKTVRSLLQLDAKQVLTGDRATEASLRGLHGPQILHVATHGFFIANRQAPFEDNQLLWSGLVLAGANKLRSGAADDGILTAAEVAQLDLLGTELVVLSACETGAGIIQIGEGVYGLRRALIMAGARSQVASLWKVADAATVELMVAYYERLLRSEGRGEALRHAQLAMLENPVRKHPYYWAGFIPIGDWRPLEVRH